MRGNDKNQKQKREADDNEVNKGKRSFLKLAGTLGRSLVGYPFLRAAEEIGKDLAREAAKEAYRVKVVDQFLEWTGAASRMSIPTEVVERASLIYELFLSAYTDTEFIPPTNWGPRMPNVRLPGGGKTYGHEAEVLRAIANFVSSSVPLITWDVNKSSWVAHQDCSQVMLASGSSNLATRTIIGEPAKPVFVSKLGNAAARLTYSIGMGSGELKRRQYHEEIKRRALAVYKADGKCIIQAEASGHWQRDDYLLVTRVPGPVAGTVYTVLAGLHGPGTRAAELLFTALSLPDLQKLKSCIGLRADRPFFQAIFRASDFKVLDGSDVATRIELVTSEQSRPVPISLMEE